MAEPAPLVIISFQKQLVAVDVRSGEHAWEYDLGFKSDMGRLHVSDEQVLFLSRGRLLCLEYQSGRLSWMVELPDPFGSRAELLVYAGHAVVHNLGEAAAVDTTDGRLSWHNRFKGKKIYEGALAAPGVCTPIDRVR